MREITILPRRQHLAGLISHQPTIVADLAVNFQYFPQGQVCYLVRPDLLDAARLDVLIRSPHGPLEVRELTWNQLRNPRVEIVPIGISEYCWHSDDLTMEATVRNIIQRHCPPVADFGASFDLDNI